MKKVLLASVLLACLFSCKKDDEVTFYTFTGKVWEHPNIAPSISTEITLSTIAFRDAGQGSFDVATTRTDAEGRFKFQIPHSEFSTSLFHFTNHPSYFIKAKKQGFVPIRPISSSIVVLPGDSPIGGEAPSDYFEKEIFLGREAFLSFKAGSLDANIDSVHLTLSKTEPETENPIPGTNIDDRIYIFHDGYQDQNNLFPEHFYSRTFRNNQFPLDTTLVERISFDTNEKLFVDWIQFSGTDSQRNVKEINLSVGGTVEVFE